MSRKRLKELGVPKCKNVGKKGKLPPLKDKSGITDYPRSGDNLPISFENSQFAMFPFETAIEIANEFPKAWCKGGNYFGNYAFEHWVNYMDALNKGKKIPVDSLRWMKKREQYIARHRVDFRLAGVIAMIKWAGFIDGSSGSGSENGDSFDEMVATIIEYGK